MHIRCFSYIYADPIILSIAMFIKFLSIVTSEDFLKQYPTDLHLRRLALEYDMNEVREIVTVLGLAYRVWNDLFTSTMTNDTIRYTALQKRYREKLFTFWDLKKATEDVKIGNPHRICKVIYEVVNTY